MLSRIKQLLSGGELPPERRIGGTEAEFVTQTRGENAEDPLDYKVIEPEVFAQAGIDFFVDERQNVWLRNGGNFHLDGTLRAEYSSGEGGSARERAALNLGGVSLMQELTRVVPYTKTYHYSGVMVDNQYSTLGNHRTMMVRCEDDLVSLDQVRGVWDSSKASRIWAWGGLVGPHGLELSQKARGVGGPSEANDHPLHRASEGLKPMGRIRLYAPYGAVLAEDRTPDVGFSRWVPSWKRPSGPWYSELSSTRMSLVKDTRFLA